MWLGYWLLHICDNQSHYIEVAQLIIAFLLSNQESGVSNLGFKIQVFNSQFLTQTWIENLDFETQVFNSQFLTQTDISFSRLHPKFWIPGLL